MGEKLAGGNNAIALLCNTLATGATLITLIFTFGPISGAHFNPAVTLAEASQGGISWSDAPVYIAAQVLGAFIGLATAHLMFGVALLQFSHHPRAGGGQLLSEFIATFGLLCVIWGCARLRSRGDSDGSRSLHYRRVLVYGFHLLRESGGNACSSVRQSLPGIRLVDAPGFIVGELLGAFAATILCRWLVPALSSKAKEVMFSQIQ